MKKVLWATIFCFMMLVLVACQTTTSANLTTQAPVTTTTSATTPTTSSATTLAPTTLAPTTLPPTTTITTTIPTTTATTTVATTDTAPVISGADDITIERNSPFIPLAGVSAYDAEDGNLTSRISYSGIVNPNAVGVYTATYTVVDNDGNVTTVNRKVTVVFTDRVAPLITGVGAKTIYVGDVFNPQTGVSANDTVDGSVAVSVSGAVNVWFPGTYQLTYSATDQAGNTATQIRTITVTFGDFVFGEDISIEESAFIVGGASITSPAISGGKINAAIANFSYVMVTIQARAAVNKDVAIMLSGSVASSHAVLPVTTSVQTFTVYFKIDSALVDQVFTLTPDGVELLDFDFSYSFAEIRDLIAPVLNVPRPDAGYKVGGTQAQLEAILRSGVTAVDDIDGNITSSIVLDFSAVNFNEVGIYDVIYTATDKGGNQASYTRKVTIGNLVDAGYLTDPHFQNNGDGKWSHKSSDGVASIAYNPTEGTMIVTVSSLGNWLSAAGAVSKLNSNGLEVDQWYLFTFTVKTTINRTMGFRMGLMSNQANNWIDDFDGRSDYLFAINNEYQTFSFYFKLNTLVSTSGAEEFIIELNLGNLNYSNIGKDGVTTFKDVAMYKVVTNFEAPTVEAVVGQNLPTKFVVGANQPVWANYVVFKDMSGLVLTPSVDVSALDMNVAGNYVVRYSVTDSHDLTTTYDLNVQVVDAQNADTTGPVITVKSGVPTTLDQFTNIQVNLTQLVDVEDAIDGIITVYPSMVQNGGLNFNVAGVYTVTYTVFDKSGNVTILAVDVTILDKQAPTISVGDFAISVGDSFDGLQGVSIIDNVDGAIALSALTIDGLAQFVANGKVFVTGVFNVTYTVADASGNVASKTIKVSVTDIIFDEDSRTPLGTPDEGPTHSSATYDAVEGATLITNINPNTQSWDHARWVYYLGAGTDLIFGKTYKFELTVKAAQATDIYFRVGATLWVDPWIDNFTGGVQSIAVTTEYITYSIIFTVDKEMVNGNAKFQFMYGYLPSDATNTIYIKNFDLLMQQEPIVNNIYDLLKLPAEQSDSVATFENNVLTISNIMNSGSARIVNYFDWNKALFALGETYRFEITIKADQARSVEFWIGSALWEEPWLDTFEGGRQTINITSEYVTYYVYFTMNKATYLANGAKFQFQYGFGSDDPLNKIYISAFNVQHVYNKLAAGKDYLNVETFGYADEAAFEAAWTNRVSGSNINPSALMSLETLNGGMILELPQNINNGWFLARKYSSLTSLGVTNDYKYLAFYMTNNTNKSQMAIWLYWSGSQNGYTVNIPAPGTSGWVVIDVLAKSGYNPSQITDFAIGFDNQSYNIVTGSITVYQISAFKNAADAFKVPVTLKTNDISTFDAIPVFNAGVVGSVSHANADAIIALLPTSVLANNGSITVPVTNWVDVDGFNKDVAGSYTFQAVLGTLPDGVGNPLDLVVSIEVVVSLEPVVLFNNFNQYADDAAFQAGVDNIVGFRVGGGTFIRTNGLLVVSEGNSYIQTNVSGSVGTNGVRIMITKASIPANLQYIAIQVKATNTTNMVKFQAFVYNAGGTHTEITSTIVSDFSKLGQGTVVYIPVSSLKSDTTQVSLVINANSGASGQLLWDNIYLLQDFYPNAAPVASVTSANQAIISGLTLKAGESLVSMLPTLLSMISISDTEDGVIPATQAMVNFGTLNVENPVMGTYPIVITPVDSQGKAGAAITITLSVVQVLNDFEAYADDAAFKANFGLVGFRISGSSWLPTNGQLVDVEGNNVLQVNYGNSTNGIRFNMTKAQLISLGATHIGMYVKTSVALTGNSIFQAFGYDASFAQLSALGNVAYTATGTYVFIPVSALSDSHVSISIMINAATGNSGVLTLDNLVIK